MKLIKCHIENFGKLSEIAFDFSDNLWVRKEENGFGKSTLAQFIKVMFYGFDNERKRALHEKEREKYRPWQGGIYGGSLTFLIDNKRYTIERIFGDRERDDFFRLYDDATGKESKDFSEKIGQEIFGLDSISFQKTIYIPQLDCNIESTDSIQAKLGNPVEAIGDMDSFSHGIMLIGKAMNQLTGKRKTGELAKLYVEEQQLSFQIIEGEKIVKQTENLQRKIEENQKKKDAIECQRWELQELMEKAHQNNYREQYEIISSTCEKKEAMLDEIEEYFSNGIPKREEIERILEISQEDIRLEASKENFVFSKKEEELKEWIVSRWGDTVPSLDKIKNFKERKREDRKSEHLNGRQAWRDKWIILNKIMDGINKNKNMVLYFFAVICIVLFFMNFLLGIFALALFGGLLWYASRDGKEAKEEDPYEEPIDLELLEYLQAYPIWEDVSEMTHLELLEGLVIEAEDLFVKEKKQQELNEKLAGIQQEIDSYFKKYRWEREGNIVKQLQEMFVKLEKYSILEGDYREYVKKREAFVQEHPEVLNDVSKMESLGELQFKWKESSREIGEIEKIIQSDTMQIETLKEQIGKLEEKKAKINIVKEEIKEKEQYYSILEHTRMYLQRARENFAAKYRTPMEQSMEKYLQIIMEEDCDFAVDTNLEIRKKEKGKLREIGNYSQGWQDLFGICLRLALVEVMYTKERPFLLLDDPFVNLDDNKIEKAKKILEQLSQEYQILYFTCHESRKF
ncbi:MAG: hypothetical protein II992_04750 [Lachnospiraceae bacterium]|nr:hypothetical protein [Lachnospiraceae bacterium]